MKIAVVGCGAVGSFYGAKLCRAGQETWFLLRSDYEVVKNNGVFIKSVKGDFHAFPRCAKSPAEIGACDLVVIALKTTANDRFKDLLPPLVSSHTAILTLQNGLGNEEALAELFGPDKIYGGLCFVCLNRIAPGTIVHSAHGKIILGKYNSNSSENICSIIAETFRHADIEIEVTDNLEKAHWEKLVWNIPFNGLGVAGIAGLKAVIEGKLPGDFKIARQCLPTNELLDNDGWEDLVKELMSEVLATANALGQNLDSALIRDNINRTYCMGAYKASTLLDFENHRPIELESLFLKPLSYAQRVNVPTPGLQAMCNILIKLAELNTKTHQ